ncbi:type II toxin-antitoxin system RelE/ParE family toxin [Jiella sp. M17.18]|uniref:type II toxin-antitoxin system RelE family toxin n=1 Tax=Jiella sp. M17.18 TaxID=3234247 RepID=UPI0034DE5774
MREIAYSKDAAKALERMPRNAADRVRFKIRQYAEDPSSLSANVKRLKGRPYYRLRVGDWRVIFDEDRRVVRIIEIGPRGGVYD